MGQTHSSLAFVAAAERVVASASTSIDDGCDNLAADGGVQGKILAIGTKSPPTTPPSHLKSGPPSLTPKGHPPATPFLAVPGQSSNNLDTSGYPGVP